MIDIKLLYKQIATTTLFYLRFDLQLHFFWGMFLTLFAVFWSPFIYLGFIATLIKDALDLWSKGRWSWDDVVFGVAGCIVGVCLVGILS